jgi:hypothetical protein
MHSNIGPMSIHVCAQFHQNHTLIFLQEKKNNKIKQTMHWPLQAHTDIAQFFFIHNEVKRKNPIEIPSILNMPTVSTKSCTSHFTVSKIYKFMNHKLKTVFHILNDCVYSKYPALTKVCSLKMNKRRRQRRMFRNQL